MAIEVKINNVPIQYPQVGDTEWGVNATNFAIQTETAFAAIGLSGGTTVDLPGTLDVTGNTTLDANLSVGGNASVTGTTSLTGNVTLANNLTVNGNTQLGNANTDTIEVTGIVNVDSGVLYVDPTNNRVGIVNSSPSKALDVTGEIQSSSHITCNGVVYADDDTTANTPVVSFIGDTNTGIGRSAADTLDFITGGNSRFRIESTGQIKAVYESQVGTDYNTQLDNGYFCRAWVNFNGTGTVAIRASGNVSSITDSGIGIYDVNFTTAMPDTNYSSLSTVEAWVSGTSAYTTSGFRIGVYVSTTGANYDDSGVKAGVFR